MVFDIFKIGENMEAVKYDSLIFILDDNDEIQKLLQKRLYCENFKKVMGFKTLLELSNSIPLNPEIIILDNYITKNNQDEREGLNNYIALKNRLPNTEFIIFSGVSEWAIMYEFINNGAYSYVIKETGSLDTVILCVKQILSKTQKVSERII